MVKTAALVLTVAVLSLISSVASWAYTHQLSQLLAPALGLTP